MLGLIYIKIVRYVCLSITTFFWLNEGIGYKSVIIPLCLDNALTTYSPRASPSCLVQPGAIQPGVLTVT